MSVLSVLTLHSLSSFRSRAAGIAVKTALTLGLAAALSAGMANTAHAAITVFTDQTLFEAAFPNLATGSFLNDFPGAIPTQQVNYSASGNGFSYAATQSGTSPQLTYLTTNILRANDASQNLIFTSTSKKNYNAIGGNFFQTNSNGIFQSGSVLVTVSDGTDTVSQVYSPTSAATGSFRGFISSLPITTLTIASESSQYNAADNLRVGTAAASVGTAAPEPGSLALLLPALGVVGVVIRRKRRA